MGESIVVQDQGMRLSLLRDRVVRGEYEVDSQAVAEAIMRRSRELLLAMAPLEGVLVSREHVGRVLEDEARRAV